MITLGIDPGKKGGIAVLRDFTLLAYAPYTSVNLCRLVLEHKPRLVTVEKVHAMPGQGVTSMFSFGQIYGEALGILKAYGYGLDAGTLLLVAPQTWKKAYRLINQPKAASIAEAMRLYPEWDFKATERSRKPSDGIADAVLIARYGYTLEHEALEEEARLPF